MTCCLTRVPDEEHTGTHGLSYARHRPSYRWTYRVVGGMSRLAVRIGVASMPLHHAAEASHPPAVTRLDMAGASCSICMPPAPRALLQPLRSYINTATKKSPRRLQRFLLADRAQIVEPQCTWENTVGEEVVECWSLVA
jgi:hypothetical protein